MSVKVAEAFGNESGGSKNSQKGDQTGQEILIRTYKKRSYSFTQCMRCIDRAMAIEAASYAKRIAECSQFGYDQADRWSGAKAIEKVGADNLEYAEKGDFDCSSFVIESYRLAGLPVKKTGYTGSIYKILMETGKFEDANNVLDDIEYAEVPTSFNTVYESEWKELGANVVIYANQLTRTGFPAMQNAIFSANSVFPL